MPCRVHWDEGRSRHRREKLLAPRCGRHPVLTPPEHQHGSGMSAELSELLVLVWCHRDRHARSSKSLTGPLKPLLHPESDRPLGVALGMEEVCELTRWPLRRSHRGRPCKRARPTPSAPQDGAGVLY
jgi:hypothetical protein